MKNFKYTVATGVALAVGLVGSASAAVDGLILTSALAEITTDASSVFDAVFPVIGTIVAMVVGIKLFKRFTNKV